MQQHYNIGRKTEVNPFESVTLFYFASSAASGFGNEATQKLVAKVHARVNEDSVVVKKVGDRLRMFFPIILLDFLTVINWSTTHKGYFTMGYSKIHFEIVYSLELQQDIFVIG